MWRHKRSAWAVWLLPLLAAVLGFIGGYGWLPHTAAGRIILSGAPWLNPSLPFTSALAGPAAAWAAPDDTLSAPDEDMAAPASALSALDGTLTAPDETREREAGEYSATTLMLPAKAEPRLILMEEESIAAYAASVAAVAASDTPLIAVYCTHSSEEYRDGTRVPGGRGGVHTVAQTLTDELNARGLPAVYCDTVHDYPDWDLSYANSLASMQALQKQYPSLEVFIDVHRDSKANSVLATGSGQLARMMLVVGSNQRLEHANWQQNKRFSEEIRDALESRVAGITRGVNVQAGRYNQQLSTKAILVEMGSTVNSTAEACASARLLAEALAGILKK